MFSTQKKLTRIMNAAHVDENDAIQHVFADKKVLMVLIHSQRSQDL